MIRRSQVQGLLGQRGRRDAKCKITGSKDQLTQVGPFSQKKGNISRKTLSRFSLAFLLRYFWVTRSRGAFGGVGECLVLWLSCTYCKVYSNFGLIRVRCSFSKAAVIQKTAPLCLPLVRTTPKGKTNSFLFTIWSLY